MSGGRSTAAGIGWRILRDLITRNNVIAPVHSRPPPSPDRATDLRWAGPGACAIIAPHSGYWTRQRNADLPPRLFSEAPAPADAGCGHPDARRLRRQAAGRTTAGT